MNCKLKPFGGEGRFGGDGWKKLGCGLELWFKVGQGGVGLEPADWVSLRLTLALRLGGSVMRPTGMR